MDSNLYCILKKGAELIDSSLAEESFLKKISVLYDEIEYFNPVYRLVGCDGEALVIRHFLDCLAPVILFRKYTHGIEFLNAADLGSGSGLPGIILASVFDKWSFSLVERMGRRAGFLRNALAMTGVNAKVIEKDLSDVNEKYDVVTFRAFRPIQDIMADIVRITEKNSVVMAYKGKDDNAIVELDFVKKKYPGIFECSLENYSVPMLDASRSMLILKRIE